jgi:hypothetical protein
VQDTDNYNELGNTAKKNNMARVLYHYNSPTRDDRGRLSCYRYCLLQLSNPLVLALMMSNAYLLCNNLTFMDNAPSTRSLLSYLEPTIETMASSASGIGSVNTVIEEERVEPVLPNLTSLFSKSGSDKYYRHHYERYYEPWLSTYRHTAGIKMLEIGAQQGKSLQVWDEYFTQPSLILGLAYGYHTEHLHKNTHNLTHVQVQWGDQSQNSTMEDLVDQGPWDIVIDDGSHIPAHVIFSLFHLWKSVKPGGIYIIEDLESSYWPNGTQIYGYSIYGAGIRSKAPNSAIDKVHQLVHVLMRHQIGARTLSIMPDDKSICSIEWAQNIVALKKCTEEQMANSPPYQPIAYLGKEFHGWLRQARLSNPAISTD